MRSTRFFLLLPLLLLSRPSDADEPARLTPLQLDLSVGPTWQRGVGPHASGTEGGFTIAFPRPLAQQRAFVAPMLEGTLANGGPYHQSLAAGVRAGWRWSFPGSPMPPLPDLYLYGRVAPVAGFAPDGRDGYGLSVGVGLTTPRLIHAFSTAAFEYNGGDAGNCLMGALLALFDHVEVVGETYRPNGGPTVGRVGLRVGLGF